LYETIKEEPKKVNAFVGFGGGHYAPAFSYYLEKENIALGHMVSKYALTGGIDEALILSLFRKSLLDKPRALIDRKGLPSKTYRELINFLEDNSIEILKI
jgi:D-tyrosyl-tRNA(Tyr) deacylase